MSARPVGYYENALWAYTDATSYAPGETVTFFVSSPVESVACTVSRVGAAEVGVHEQSGIRAGHHEIPEHAYRDGCAWPDTFALTVGADWPSGYSPHPRGARPWRARFPRRHPSRARRALRIAGPRPRPQSGKWGHTSSTSRWSDSSHQPISVL